MLTLMPGASMPSAAQLGVRTKTTEHCAPTAGCEFGCERAATDASAASIRSS
jgi:hypothetical protein